MIEVLIVKKKDNKMGHVEKAKKIGNNLELVVKNAIADYLVEEQATDTDFEIHGNLLVKEDDVYAHIVS
jgi:hypothetical protein